MLYRIAAELVRETFHNLLDLKWAVKHKKALRLGFYHHKSGKRLQVMLYSPASYEAVMVKWDKQNLPAERMTGWKILSYHDASFRETLQTIFKAVDELGISMLDGYNLRGMEVIELSDAAAETIRREILYDYTNRPHFLVGEAATNYLMNP